MRYLIRRHRRKPIIDRLALWAIVFTGFAAIAAIVLGYYQFHIQQDNAELIAHANIKPLLEVFGYDLKDNKSLYLINYGIGSAIITSVNFAGKNNTSNKESLRYLVKSDCSSDNYQHFTMPETYIEPGGKILLASITRKNLEDQGVDSDQATKIIKSWEKQMANITVKIAYKDILGKRQTDLNNFCWHRI
jgi:hypothetical protein